MRSGRPLNPLFSHTGEDPALTPYKQMTYACYTLMALFSGVRAMPVFAHCRVSTEGQPTDNHCSLTHQSGATGVGIRKGQRLKDSARSPGCPGRQACPRDCWGANLESSYIAYDSREFVEYTVWELSAAGWCNPSAAREPKHPVVFTRRGPPGSSGFRRLRYSRRSARLELTHF